MPDEVTWKIEEHTRAKHEILRIYLGAWFPILTIRGNNRRVIFLDGFAGPGVYSNGELGSPLIALDTLINHTQFEQMSQTEFLFLFVEKDTERFKSLQHEIQKFWSLRNSKIPENIKVYSYNDEFAGIAQNIIHHTRGVLAPTFAFLDPFGWSGVPITTIRDLLSSKKCEVLFNFMFDSVNRFISDDRPAILQNFSAMFGVEDFQSIQNSIPSGVERKQFLVGLYKKQLQDVCRFNFVRSFELMSASRGRTEYMLIFGTRHAKGLQAMKDAMWRLDPTAGVAFRGSAGNQLVLFEPKPDTAPLKTALVEQFSGLTVLVEEIEKFVIEETDYKDTHYRPVLKDLEKSGYLSCMSDRKRRETYPIGTVLRFTSAAEPKS